MIIIFKITSINSTMNYNKLLSISLFSIFAISSAQSQEVQLELPVGVQSQVSLQIKLPNETGKCNIEITVPGQAKFEREVTAPNFQALVEFTPPAEGSFPIEWRGKLKKRGLNSVLGCDGAGKVMVVGKTSASDIAAKWSDYFSKSKPEAVECVRLGLEINRVLFESTDPAAKLVAPNDSSVKPIFEKCDSFFRQKQPQQNYACTIPGGIKTFCNELFAERGADGKLSAISKLEAIKLHFNGREWMLAHTETGEAKATRLKSEEDSKKQQEADAATRTAEANSKRLKAEEENKKQQIADAAKSKALSSEQKSKPASSAPEISNEEKAGRAYNIGICLGAAGIAMQRFGDNATYDKYMNKFRPDFTNYEKFIVEPCKSKMTEACFYKLPEESRFYFNGITRSRTELNSPKPVTILSSNRIGTDRTTLIAAIAGYCDAEAESKLTSTTSSEPKPADVDMFCSGLLFRASGLINSGLSPYRGEALNQLKQLSTHLERSANLLMQRGVVSNGSADSANAGVSVANNVIGKNINGLIQSGSDPHKSVMGCLKRLQ